MITHIPSFLNNKEVEYYINLYHTLPRVSRKHDGRYRFTYVGVLKYKTDVFEEFGVHQLRVQMVDDKINQIKKFHKHATPFTFVIFLNDNFEGGELVFQDKEIKPTKGDLVMFTGGTDHTVNNCIGERYTLVGFNYTNPYLNQKTLI